MLTGGEIAIRLSAGAKGRRKRPKPLSLPVNGTNQQKKEPFGVSFLGLTLTLVSIAVLATIGIPLWFAQPSITLEKAAELLVQDMHNVQDHALITHSPCRIEFDPDGGGYGAYTSRGEALVSPMDNGDYRRAYDADAVFRGVKIEKADFRGKSTLAFDRGGNALAPGTVVLSYNGETRTVKFDVGNAYIVRPGEQ